MKMSEPMPDKLYGNFEKIESTSPQRDPSSSKMEDARFSMKMEEAAFSAQKNKMNDIMDKSMKYNSPKIKRKALNASKDMGLAVPDKLELLKDQNLGLKRHQQDLDTDIKIISTQLRRMVEQLKGDKLILGKANHFEKQLDDLIENQVKLKEDEQNLMKKVKTA